MAVVGGVKDYTADVFDFFDTPRNEDHFESESGKKGSPGHGKLPKHGVVSDNNKENGRGAFKPIKRTSVSSSDSDSEIETVSQSSRGNSKNGNITPINVKGETYSSDSFTDSSSAYSDSSSDDEDLIETEREKFRQNKSYNKSNKPFNRPSDLEVHQQDDMEVKEAWSSGISRIDIQRKTQIDSDEDVDQRQSQVRPKSSKFRSREHTNNLNNIHRSGSESEMTDVSPLNSPRNNNSKHNDVQYDYDDDRSSVKLESSKLDLSVLMEAVDEIERERERNERLRVNSRRVMFAPPKASKQQDLKGNFSYDKSRTKSIEKENQRLLKQIMRHIGPKQNLKFSGEKPTQRMTPSGVNRTKEQRRIEAENMALLQRIQTTKSSKGMSRNEQLTEYKKTSLYGVPLAAMHPLDDEDLMLGRSRSMMSMLSGTTASTLNSRRSRPSSAKSNASTMRPGSAKSTTSTLRPGSAKSIRSVCSSIRPGSVKSKSSTSYRPQWNDRFSYT